MKDFLHALEHKHGFRVKESRQLSGGSISLVYHLKTHEDDLVLKLNNTEKYSMFLAEKSGLETLLSTDTLRIPKVWSVGTIADKSYILMEYLAPKTAEPSTYKNFGEKLAALHQKTAVSYGFDEDNWIGSLPQSNKKHTRWNAFYWEERIKPQYDLALQNKLLKAKDVPSEVDFLKVIEQEFCDTKPSLIHGDLWNGNYLITNNGNVALIDPAVYYGHPMMDIGMTKLFGGFSNDFYEAYRHECSCKTHWDAQIELAQLYYLLVHLNLFGSSYLPSVQRIKSKYFHG